MHPFFFQNWPRCRSGGGGGGGAQLVRTDRLCKCRTPMESSEDGLSSCSTPGGIEQFAESGQAQVSEG